MKHEALKNTIATLEKLRDDYYDQLDASVLAELDDVLQQLHKLSNSDKQGLLRGDIALRALRIMDVIIRMVTNISNWIM